MTRSVSILVAGVLLSSCADRVAIPGPSSREVVPFVQENGGQPRAWATFPEGGTYPVELVSGADGAIWLTEQGSNAIGRFDVASGAIAHYPTGGAPQMIAAGLHGSMWFTDPNDSRVGRVTEAGKVTEFSVPSHGYLYDIALGSDGDMWFSESPDIVGAVSPGGVFREYHNPSGQMAFRMNSGPDGAMWFTEINNGTIGRVSTTGQFTEYKVAGNPFGIISFEGNLWFTDYNQGGVEMITTSGQSVEYLTGLPWDSDLCAGPNGFLWFIHDDMAGKLASFNPITHVTKDVGFAPGTGDGFSTCASGSDGNIYTLAYREGDIVARVLDVMKATPSSLKMSAGTSEDFTVTERHYAGSWSATTSDPGVATVSPVSGGVFQVTAVGNGSATLTVDDEIGNSLPVSITVQ